MGSIRLPSHVSPVSGLGHVAAAICAVMSSVGIVFLSFLGIRCHYGLPPEGLHPSQASSAASGCFFAAAMYAGTLLVSLLCLRKPLATATGVDAEDRYEGMAYEELPISLKVRRQNLVSGPRQRHFLGLDCDAKSSASEIEIVDLARPLLREQFLAG